MYEKFLFARYPNLHKSWFSYDVTKTAINLMGKHELWEPLKRFAERKVDFLDASVSNVVVATVQSEIMLTLFVRNVSTADGAKFSDTTDPDLLQLAALELLKLSLPLAAIGEGAVAVASDARVRDAIGEIDILNDSDEENSSDK